MEMLPTDEQMCHILSTSADKTETVIPDTKTSTKIGSGCNVVGITLSTPYKFMLLFIAIWRM